MKTIIASLVVILSSAAFAGSGGYVDQLKKMTWEELQDNWDVDFEGDTLWFGGTAVSVFNTCMDDEETFRTATKVRVSDWVGDDYVYVGEEFLYKSIYGHKTYPDGDDTIDVPVTYSTTRTIRIVENDDDFEGDLLFKRDYTIPACK